MHSAMVIDFWLAYEKANHPNDERDYIFKSAYYNDEGLLRKSESPRILKTHVTMVMDFSEKRVTPVTAVMIF